MNSPKRRIKLRIRGHYNYSASVPCFSFPSSVRTQEPRLLAVDTFPEIEPTVGQRKFDCPPATWKVAAHSFIEYDNAAIEVTTPSKLRAMLSRGRCRPSLKTPRCQAKIPRNVNHRPNLLQQPAVVLPRTRSSRV